MTPESDSWTDAWGATFLLRIDTWRVAIRQIAGSTNYRTVIAAITPPGVAVGGNAFVVSLTPRSLAAIKQPLFDRFQFTPAVASEAEATQLGLI